MSIGGVDGLGGGGVNWWVVEEAESGGGGGYTTVLCAKLLTKPYSKGCCLSKNACFRFAKSV